MAQIHHPGPDPPQSRRLVARAIPLVVLVLLSCLFYWKLALTDQYTWFDHPDMVYLEIPKLQFQARQIQSGHFPLWDPHLWAGQPLIGQTQPGPLYPFNLLLCLLAPQKGHLSFRLLNWYWVFIHFLAAAFFFLMAKTFGLSTPTAIVAACGFGFGGFVGSAAWLDVVNGAIWAPLVFRFLAKATREVAPWPSAAWGGLFLGISWLSGHHEVPILLSAAALGAWVWLALYKKQRLAPATVFFLTAFCISAVQLIPTYEFGMLARRWVGMEESVGWSDRIHYSIHTLYSLPAKSLVAMVVPGFGRFADASPFMGGVLAVLAAVGCAGGWRRRRVRWAFALFLFSIIYALGALTPFHGVLYALLPGFDKARIPSRAIALASLGLATLAAFGLEHILNNPQGLGAKRARQWLAAAGLVIATASVGFTLAGHNVDDSLYLAGLLWLAAAALLRAFSIKAISRRVATAAILAIVLIELGRGAPALYPHRADKNANGFVNQLLAHQDLVDCLKSLKEDPMRVLVDDGHIPLNFGDWHGIDMLHGYMAAVSRNLLRHELHEPRVQDLFSVTHALLEKPQRPEHELVCQSTGKVHVFRSLGALPRYRIIHSAQAVADEDALRQAIRDPATDLRNTALFLAAAPRLEDCGGQDRLRLLARTTDRLLFEAELECRGLLVVSETMFPGWEVSIDGKPSRMWEAYGVFRSVVIDRGKHLVEMRFRPRSLFVGAAFTGAGLLGVLGATLWADVRRRRTRSATPAH